LRLAPVDPTSQIKLNGATFALDELRIEDCTGISCEELRPDLHGVRLAYEVVGHIVPVDGHNGAYVAKALRAADVIPGHDGASTPGIPTLRIPNGLYPPAEALSNRQKMTVTLVLS
jgi:hypothetical protein